MAPLKPILYGLFCHEETDEPMHFAMAFGPKRKRIRDLVEGGGGVLMDPGERDARGDRILLCDESTSRASFFRRMCSSVPVSVDVFDCRYVEDCVSQNRLLPNLLEYRQVNSLTHPL